MYLEDDSTWGFKRIYHGITFQELLIVISLMHEMDITSLMSKMGKECSFSIDTELESAQGFDDIVVWHEQNKDIVHKFIQVKHNQDGTKKISVSSLLTKSGKFSILKLLLAYLKIKNSAKFSDGIKHFLFATNMDLDSPYSIQHEVRNLRAMLSGENKGKELSFVRIDTKDEFLDIGDSARYRISDSDGSVAQYLKQNMDFIKREIGKEVSNKEIEDFLNKLVFAVNQPNEIKLAEIIENELGKEFNNIDKKNVYGRFLVEVLDWMKAREGKFLSHEEINEFFEKIREEILGAIWFGIIEPVASFTGRGRVLTALHNMLQRSAKKQAVISQVASISGLGGVGKSELARKYAYKYGKDYYGNVIWISAENSKTMESSFLDLAKDDKLGISPQDKYGNDKMIETIVKETYAFFARRGRKSLFIFDNAEGYKDISKFLPLSLDNKPYILITSRNKDWGISEDEGEIKTIQLGVFKETEALKFVKRALNIRNNLQDEEIKNLTEELQYFPLALKQAVAYINEKNVVLSYRGKEKIGVSDYLKKYEEEAEKLLDFESKYGGDRYTKTTFITWKITIDAIAQKECGFEALSVLEIMAYLAPDKIRIEEIFSKLIADDEEKLWSAVELLDRYSMIDLKEGVANIHRLVQKVTELNLQKEGREEEVLRKALELVNSGDLAIDNFIHVASVWGYASKYDKLIDNFYFNFTYGIQKCTPLHSLAESGDYEAVKRILTRIEDAHLGRLNCIVNAKNKDCITPLHSAACGGNLDILKYLISKGADINSGDRTLLHSAVLGQNLRIVEYLINKGADVNAKDERGFTPLYLSALCKGYDITEHLIEKGADVNAKNNGGNTSLHLAAMNGKIDVAKVLLKHNADVNAKNNEGKTALYYAAKYNHQELVELLLAHGASYDY